MQQCILVLKFDSVRVIVYEDHNRSHLHITVFVTRHWYWLIESHE